MTTQSDLIERVKRGEKAAFSQLMAESAQVLHEAIRKVLPKLTEAQRHPLMRRIVREIYQRFSEFANENEPFDAWLRRMAANVIQTERVAVIRAKKGDKSALVRLVTDYEQSIRKVFQDETLRITGQNEETIFRAILEDSARAVPEFRLHEDSFGHWLRELATEHCAFLYVQEQLRSGAKEQDKTFQIFFRYYDAFMQHVLWKNFPAMPDQDQEDVLQEVRLQACRTLPEFRGNSYSFKDWLCKTIRGIGLNMINKQKKHQDKAQRLKAEALLHTAPVNPDRSYVVGEIQKCVQHAISLLSEKFKEVILLRELDELSYEKITEVLGVSIGTVKSRTNRAKKQLNILLEELRCIDML